MRDSTERTLRLFIEKADLLLSFSFTNSVKKGLRLELRGGTDRETEIDFVGPDIEAVHAFLNTYRLFIQDSDGISFRAINDNLLDDPDLSKDWKQEFLRVRGDINAFLDGPLGINVVFNGNPIATRREVQSIFIYGDISHIRYKGDEQNREAFERWRSKPFIYAPLWFAFIDTLTEMLKAIAYISRLSKEELNLE
jgi:hypothetical protein